MVKRKAIGMGWFTIRCLYCDCVALFLEATYTKEVSSGDAHITQIYRTCPTSPVAAATILAATMWKLCPE